jgi:hypothetical protein
LAYPKRRRIREPIGGEQFFRLYAVRLGNAKNSLPRLNPVMDQRKFGLFM